MNGTTAATAGNDLRGQGFFSILGNLREDLTDMVKRELNLLKAEFSEKASAVGKQTAFIAAGGIVALIGAQLLLVGICAFIAFGLTKAGLSPLVAGAIAFLAFGAILGVAGFFTLKKGIAQLSKTSLAPDQTLRTVKEISNSDIHPISAESKQADDAPEKGGKVRAARASAERKIQEVQNEAAEIRSRLTPNHMWAATCSAANRRPQVAAGIGASVLALGYMMIRRRRHTRVIHIG